MLLTDRLLLEQVGLKLFERKSKFISFCQASEKKKHIEKSPIFVQNLDFFWLLLLFPRGKRSF